MCNVLYKYREVEQRYGTQQRVIFPEWTNGFAIHNIGTTILIVNNTDVLQPGESKSLGGNAGEIYDGRIDLMFQVPTPAPAVITNSAVLTFKYYTEIFDPVKKIGYKLT